MGLADVHAHLTLPPISASIDEVIGNAEKAGVTTIISNALNSADSHKIRDLAGRFSCLKPAYGIHPVEAVRAELHQKSSHPDDDNLGISVEEGIAWIRDNVESAWAVGEIGLDAHWVPEPLWQKQEDVLQTLLGLALEANKPVIIHSRKREKRTFEIVLERRIPRAVWHCFGGKLKLAKQIAEHGYYFSIPANARRSQSFAAMLTGLPRELLLFETDCPYLSPDRERHSQPADIVVTRAFAAELWKVSEDEVEKQVTDNFIRLFGVEP
jgi:TatD DNase family protein